MAGHSQFKNIMHRKGSQDKKRAKIFTKINREIMVSVKQGSADFNSNPRLRVAIATAKEVNMPKDNIERAIKKASREFDGINYEEMHYEGYGPYGVAIIIEALTDNRNRSASDIRTIFTKHGGSLGETGSVNFMFEHLGAITFSKKITDFEELFELATEISATDIREEDSLYIVNTQIANLHHSTDFLIKNLKIEPLSIAIEWMPKHIVSIEEVDKAQGVLRCIDALEDNDDIQKVFANFEISQQILEKCS